MEFAKGASGFHTEVGNITAPTTDAAKALDGSYGGFQPKPAVEVIIVAMKPLSEKTYVDQALKNGKGITWLDDCRVPGEPASFGNPTTGFHDSLGRNTVKRQQSGMFNMAYTPPAMALRQQADQIVLLR